MELTFDTYQQGMYMHLGCSCWISCLQRKSSLAPFCLNLKVLQGLHLIKNVWTNLWVSYMYMYRHNIYQHVHMLHDLNSFRIHE